MQGLDFARLCGLSTSEAVDLRQDADNYALKATAIVDSLSLITGHELGHLVLGHAAVPRSSPQAARENEYAADEFGLKIATQAGFWPYFALTTTFPMFADLEGGSHSDSSDHPPASCRSMRLADAMLKDPRWDASKLSRAAQARLPVELAALRKQCAQDEKGDPR
jgi:hypothetical protein